MDSSLEKGELSHLRHKLQCADVLNNDLMDEIKLLQDDNSKLTKKVSELDKRLSKTQVFNSPSYRKDVSLNRSLTAGDIEAEFLDLCTKYEKLQEDLRKSKMMVMELEDNLYSVRKERDELERKNEQKDEAVKSLKEALKNVETEFMENVDEKGVLNSKLADKDAVIESLRAHCNQLEEMQVILRSGDERKSFGAALLRNYCPNLSADTSHSFSMIEESNAVLDLGSEVIDIQLREAKSSLEKAEESLRHCQDEKNKLEVKCQQVEERAKLTEEELLSKIQDCQSELELLNQERISSDMKNQKLIEDLQSTINTLQGQLEAIRTESTTLAHQLSDKCSELVATKAQLEKSEDQNTAMSDEIKSVSSALKTTEESVRVLQTELDTARSKAEATETNLLCKIQEYKTELEQLEHDKRVADAKSHTCIQDLQSTIRTLEVQLEAIKAESSALTHQLSDKGSELDATKAQLKNSEDQNAAMSDEIKRVCSILQTTEETVIALQAEFDTARNNAKATEKELLCKIQEYKTELEQQEHDKRVADAKNHSCIQDLQSTISRLERQLEAIKAESSNLADQLSDKCSQLDATTAQLEKSEGQNAAMTDEIKRVCSNLQTTEESVRVLHTELDAARNNAEATEKELLCKIQEYKTELEQLEHDKRVADAKNDSCIQDLQSTISTLEGQLEAIKTESSTLADQLSDKCSELEATMTHLEKSENHNAFMAEENKRICTALKSTEESVLALQKEREDALEKCESAEQRADDAEKSAVIRIAEEAAQCKEIYERKIEQCRAELTLTLQNFEEDLRRCQEERDSIKLITDELASKVKECENELEVLKQEKSRVDSQNQKLIEDLHTNVNSLEVQLEAFKVQSSTLAVQLSDTCSQLETIKRQLEKSEDQNASMSEENKRMTLALMTTEESLLAAESGREEAISKCQLAEQRADKTEKDAVIKIAEEVAQCQKDYEEKTNQYQIEMEKVLQKAEENLKECQDERDSLITKCHQQEELANDMEQDLRLKIQDCESRMEMLKQEKSRQDSQNKKCIEDLQSAINSLECQLEAIKAESSNLADQLSEKFRDLETITKRLEESEEQNIALSEEIQRGCSALRSTEETVVALQAELDTARRELQLAEQRADQTEKDAVIRIAEEVAQCEKNYEEKSNEHRIEMEKVLEKAEINLKECQEERDNLITKCQQQEDEAKVAEKRMLEQTTDFETRMEELQEEKSQLNLTSQKCIDDLKTTINSVQGELKAIKAEKANLVDQLSEKNSKLEVTMTKLEELEDQNAVISEEIQRVCSSLKTTEETVVALQTELDTARSELQLAEQRSDIAEKDAVIKIAEEVAQCKEIYEQKTEQYRAEMEKALEKAEENVRQCQEERDELIIKCQQQEDEAKLTEKQNVLTIADFESRLEDLMEEKSQNQKRIEDLERTISKLEGQIEGIKTESSTLAVQFSDKCSELETIKNQLQKLENQKKQMSEENKQINAALKTTEESVLALQNEREDAMHRCQLAEQRADDAEKSAVIRIAEDVAQCKEIYEQKTEQYRAEMEKALEKAEEDVRQCQEEKAALEIECQEAEDKISLTEKELLSKIQEWATEVEELKQEKLSLNMKNQKATEDLRSTITSLQGQLQAVKVESSTLIEQLNKKSNDLEIIRKEMQALQTQNASISEENQRINLTLKNLEESSRVSQAERETAVHKWQLAEQRAINAEKNVDLRITKEMAQYKQNYAQKTEQYRASVQKVVEEEMDKVKQLKQLLHDSTEECDELKKKYDELKRKYEDAISSQSQLAEQGEKLKREIGLLRRDYLESQHVIHLMEKTLNKQTERLQQLESNSDHKFLAPSGGSFQSLHRRHQMSDSNLSSSNPRRESCSSIGSSHVPRRRSDETDDRRLSSISIASTSSNTSSSSEKFKAVPNGSGCLFKCEDEDEFQFQETNIAALKHKRQIGSTKLPGLKGDTRSEEDRFSELFRRNTMVPLHLKSCYPSEYITCDDSEVDENKLKQLPGYTRSTSGPLVGRLKDVSTISLPVSLVFSPPRKKSSVALSSRKPLGETSQF